MIEETMDQEKEQANQLTDMLDDLLDLRQEDSDEEPKEEVEVKADKASEQSAEEVDSVEDSESEEQEVSEASDGEVSTSADEDKTQEVAEESSEDKEEASHEEQIEALHSQLNEVAQKAMSAPVNVNPPAKTEEDIKQETAAAEESDKETQVVRDLIPFVTNDDYEKAMTEPGELNALMNRVYDSAITYMTQSVPQLVGRMVTQQTSMRNLVDDFYKTNEDLVPMKSFVGFVANELAAKNPGWEYDKLFKEVAVEVRKRVNISTKASSVETQASKQRPAFAKKPSGRQSIGKKLSEMETDISDLM